MAVPPRTHTPNRVVVARVERRRGRQARALALLADQVDELVATSNMQGASLVALELMAVLDDLGHDADAAELVGYLDAADLLDAPGFATLARHPRDESSTGAVAARRTAGALLDDEGALRRMREMPEEITLEP